jgi:two-component system NarL family response regulator
METGTKKLPEVLTPRQIQVLQLLANGLSYKEIGAQLFLSPRTIKYHMTEIMDRLHLEKRAQVLALAGQMGLTAQKPSE